MLEGRGKREEGINNILTVGRGCYKSDAFCYGSRSLPIAQIADRPFRPLSHFSPLNYKFL
ncbi:hypothetical protein C7B69_18015 [filamentous cyanobacterium Phorm 46]|nr:hypothetical protein C7B69_18015 [filamentous cyanobacterium Phorm 46]PSB51227.1 hypothetical protein C7B67_11795 [filamentous cyanobacterium Phorm 6]